MLPGWRLNYSLHLSSACRKWLLVLKNVILLLWFLLLRQRLNNYLIKSSPPFLNLVCIFNDADFGAGVLLASYGEAYLGFWSVLHVQHIVQWDVERRSHLLFLLQFEIRKSDDEIMIMKCFAVVNKNRIVNANMCIHAWHEVFDEIVRKVWNKIIPWWHYTDFSWTI